MAATAALAHFCFESFPEFMMQRSTSSSPYGGGPFMSSRISPGFVSALLLLAALLMATLAGMAIGLGNYALDALAFAALFGLGLLLLPIEVLMTAHFVIAVIIAGCVVYFLRIQQGHWLPFGSALLVGVKVLLTYMTTRERRTEIKQVPFFLIAIGVYLAGIAISVAANRLPLMQVIVGLKNLLPCWAVFAAIAFGFVPWPFVKRLWLWLIAIPIVSFPFVVYQHFIVAAKRTEAASRYDSVVGTFGGNPEGGGHTSTLMIYMIAGLLASVALYRAGKISRLYMIVVITAAFLAIVLSENKSAFVLLPAAFIIFDLDTHLRRPVRFVLVGLVMGSVLIGMYKAYNVMYYDEGIRGKEGVDKLEYFFDPNNVKESGEVGRGAALTIWWSDRLYTPLQRLFGYGPGASRAESTVAVGSVAKRYVPWQINSTAVAQLLWDQGIFGCLSFIGILAGAIAYGFSRYRWQGEEEDRQLLRAATGIALVLIPFSLHNSHLVNAGQDQYLLTLVLGTVLVAGRQLTREPIRKSQRQHRFGKRHRRRADRSRATADTAQGSAGNASTTAPAC